MPYVGHDQTRPRLNITGRQPEGEAMDACQRPEDVLITQFAKSGG